MHKSATILAESDKFRASISYIFVAIDQSACHQLIEQAAGSRYRTSQQLSSLFDAELTLFIKQKQYGHLRQRIVKVLEGLHDTQDEIAQVGPPKLAEAPGDKFMFVRSD